MFTIIIDGREETPAIKVHFEHSLVSLSKWESIYCKPFYDDKPKTGPEMGDYITSMVIGEAPDDLLERMTREQVMAVTKYIGENQTATTFFDPPSGRPNPSKETMTSELIYFWMVHFRIPFFPAETWNLGRLMALIKIASIKNSKPVKMSPREQQEHYARLNAERRAKYGTSG